MNRKQQLIAELKAMEVAEPTKQITQPSDAFPLYTKYLNKKQEYFLVTTLDGAHNVIKTHVITIGLANRTLIHPREVFYPAVKDRAVGIIVVHNHPSGSLTPSKEDIDITGRMKKAGKVMGIDVLDHLIISKEGFYSFLEKGMI